MTIFINPRPYRRQTRSWCQWCCKRAAMKDLFKLRDGPLDFYFCDSEHALDWLEYRHSSVEANKLLRMLPAERAKALGGRTIEEVIRSTHSDCSQKTSVSSSIGKPKS